MAEFIWGVVCGAIGTLAIIFMMVAWQVIDEHRKYPEDYQS